VNPLAGTIVVKPQELLDSPAVRLDRAGGQPANLAGGFVLIEELHVLQCAAQKLLGQFARSKSMHPERCQQFDSRRPLDILYAFRSYKQS
jgi:hypothetical protein